MVAASLAKPAVADQKAGARTEVVHIFCDAASTPAKAVAVFMSDSVLAFTDWVPPAKLLEELEPRKDQQICALELMAIVLGKYSRYIVRRNCVHSSQDSCMFRSQHVPSRMRRKGCAHLD